MGLFFKRRTTRRHWIRRPDSAVDGLGCCHGNSTTATTGRSTYSVYSGSCRLCPSCDRTSFCCGWPDSLELSLGQSPGSRCYYRQLQALVENVFVFSVPVQLAQLMCYDEALTALYKFTFSLLLLTYSATGGCPGSCTRLNLAIWP